MDRPKNPATLLVLFLCTIFLSSQITIIAQKHTLEEAFKAMEIAWNKDGTLNRTTRIPMVPPTPSANSNNPNAIALSRDIKLSFESKAYIRLYIPVNPPKDRKLPLIIYFRGGAFIFFSASSINFHNFCNDVASKFPAIVASVEYRLAPENRLPAAYEDALNAIFWAKDQALGIGGRHPWMEQYADFSRVFLLGSSAGANIAYHVALQALDFDIRPLNIRGLMLNQAYFSGVERTQSEIHLEDDLGLYISDVLWTLALPENFSRDHEYCNPMSGGTYQGRVFLLPKVYIKGDYGDPLVDRSILLAQFLESCRVPVYHRFNPGGFHAIELENKSAAQELYDDMKNFVYSVCGTETESSYVPTSISLIWLGMVRIMGMALLCFILCVFWRLRWNIFGTTRSRITFKCLKKMH